MSSANSNISLLTNIINNNSKIAKSMGASTEPCGTPLVTVVQLDWIVLSIYTLLSFHNKNLNHVNNLPLIPTYVKDINVTQCQRPFSLLKSNIGE